MYDITLRIPRKTLNATQAKNQFGQLLDDAQAEPVAISKNGRDVAVLLSMADYKLMMNDQSTHDLVQNIMKKAWIGSVHYIPNLPNKFRHAR